MMLIKESNHLRLPYKDIKEATKDFTTVIGRGGYGSVYRGQLSLSGELTIVAVKRLQLNNLSGQGLKEFLTEIQLLARYKHQNLISLLGFCEELNEKFLIYEHAEHGSLDKYLKPAKTTCPIPWKQRLSICIDAARGLDHLHNHVSPNERVIHRDIKSANILLDHKWKAMIADFGLSKIGRANENDTFLITNPCGTQGYCDPAYIHTGFLTKESDVYSFGVVLLEIFCGRLCFINVDNKERFLAPLAQRYYKEGKLNLIMDPILKMYNNSDSMKAFLEIAFQCLQDDRKQRPPMGLVLQKLEKAVKLLDIEEAPELLELEEALGLQKLVETMQTQEAWDWKVLVETLELKIGESRVDYKVIRVLFDMPEAPLSYITRDEIYLFLSTGVIVDEGKVLVSINDEGKTQEMISAIKVLPQDGHKYQIQSEPKSRFSKIARVRISSSLKMQVKIRTQFLSSDVAYVAYLVCKPDTFPEQLTMEELAGYSLSYTFDYSMVPYTSFPLKIDDNGWLMFELFQTTHFKRTLEFEVTLCGMNSQSNVDCSTLLFEGIYFLPMRKYEDENEIKNSAVKNLSTSNIDWDKRLPSDYKQILYYSNKKMMKVSQSDAHLGYQEEAYSILTKGVLIKVNSHVNMWLWITKLDGKKCFVLPPTLLSYNMKLVKLDRIRTTVSRVNFELFVKPSRVLGMHFKVPHGVMSTNTTYGCFLVYKLLRTVDQEVMVKIWLNDGRVSAALLRMLKVPAVGPDDMVIVDSTVSNLNSIQLPKERKDGWWEVKIGNKSVAQWLSMQPQYLSTQQDRHSNPFSPTKSTWKDCFRLGFSDNRSGDIADGENDDSFTLDPRRFSDITVYMSHHHLLTPQLIVEGIEFRPV